MWSLPSSNDSWMYMDDEGQTKLCIKGMPLYWKLINVLVVIPPKALLWKFTVRSGTLFLMETAAMQDLIVNSTALGFIMNIDELLFATITSDKVRYMLTIIEPYAIHRTIKDKHEETLCQ